MALQDREAFHQLCFARNQPTTPVRPAKLELHHAKHESLSPRKLIGGVTTIDHVNDLIDRWAVDLLIRWSWGPGWIAHIILMTRRIFPLPGGLPTHQKYPL